MSEESTPHRPSPARWGLALLAACFLYVLSIGPANALHARGALGGWYSLVERVYVPLGYVYERVPVVKVALDAWMELWSRLL